MLLDSDWREELRLLRLNNPAYRIVFLLLDVLRWFAYLAGALLLVAVCWYIVTPREYAPAAAVGSFDSNSGARADSAGATDVVERINARINPTEPATAAAYDPDAGAEAPMTPERIEYLRSFASRVKGQPATVQPAAVQPAAVKEGEDPNTAIDRIADQDSVDEGIEQLQSSVAEPSAGGASGEDTSDSVDLTVYAVPAPDSIIPGIIDDNQLVSEPPAAEFAPLAGRIEVQQPASASNDSVDADTESQPTEVTELATPAVDESPLNETAARASGDVEVPSLANVTDLKYTPNDRPYAGTEWVMAQDESRYTIQIGSTVNRPFLVRFVDTLPEPHLAAIFNFRINRWDRWEHVLIYGSFATREAANLTLGTLSQANRRYGAFARSFRVIRSDMDAATTVTAQNRGSGAVQNQ